MVKTSCKKLWSKLDEEISKEINKYRYRSANMSLCYTVTASIDLYSIQLITYT